mmetsp:Transcript_36085/g.113303  ORF Transcript_36085/g.113303 Transcript_36085/m.113303 type:complete len:488 (-) Transcript_36085:175-1638(-)
MSEAKADDVNLEATAGVEAPLAEAPMETAPETAVEAAAAEAPPVPEVAAEAAVAPVAPVAPVDEAVAIAAAGAAAAVGVAPEAAAAGGAQGESAVAVSTASMAPLATPVESHDPVHNLFYQRYTPVFHKAKKGGTPLITNEEYARFVKILSTWQSGVAHTAEQARVHKKYQLMANAVEGDQLRRNGKRVPTFEQCYHIIMQKHTSLGHARALRKIKKAVDEDYYGIPESAVKTFIECCPTCAQSKTKSKGAHAEQLPLHIKNILLSTNGARAQLDLLDMTANESEGFKYVLLYVDLFSGFSHALPIQERNAECIADAVLKVMSVAVVPTVLYSQNCREFLPVVIQTIKDMFPGAHVILGRWNSENNANSVIAANFLATFKESLEEWTTKSSRQDWNRGCFVINAKLNMQPSSQNNNLSPYQLYYSKAPQPVLFSALGEITYSIGTEDGLYAAIEAVEKGLDVSQAVVKADSEFWNPDVAGETKMEVV